MPIPIPINRHIPKEYTFQLQLRLYIEIPPQVYKTLNAFTCKVLITGVADLQRFFIFPH